MAALIPGVFLANHPDSTLAADPASRLHPDTALSSASDDGGELGLPSITPRTRDTVAASNQRPPKPEVSNQTAIAGRAFTYTVPEVTDPDSDTLDYNAFQGESLNSLPNG